MGLLLKIVNVIDTHHAFIIMKALMFTILLLINKRLAMEFTELKQLIMNLMLIAKWKPDMMDIPVSFTLFENCYY